MLALIEKEPSKAAFARKVGTDPAYISQILSAKTKAEVGNDLARAIEKAYGLRHGWMDHDNTQAEAAETANGSPLLSALEMLTPEQRQEFIEQINKQVAINKQIYAQLASAPSINVRARELKNSGKLPFIQRRRKEDVSE